MCPKQSPNCRFTSTQQGKVYIAASLTSSNLMSVLMCGNVILDVIQNKNELKPDDLDLHISLMGQNKTLSNIIAFGYQFNETLS